MNLYDVGWNAYFEQQYAALRTPASFPARVAKAAREKYVLYGASGAVRADITGNLRFHARSMSDLPAVGDWVVAVMRPEGTAAIIESVLPRMNTFSRKAAGSTTDEQVLVANVDVLFLVNGLDGDYNLRRIERYLALVRDNHARPVIVLNKTDQCADVAAKRAAVASVACGVPIISLSALRNEGIDAVREHIAPGVTAAFLGSSGVGKSTIINCLLGAHRQEVGAVREGDSRGRHVTTRRELLLLPGGGVVIDNPGMRELCLWLDEGALDNTFSDIRDLARQCRFGDCRHVNEPGCAVLRAVAEGHLDSTRLRNYEKLGKELRYLATRKEAKARNEKILAEKKISRWSKQLSAHRKKNRF